MTGPTAVEAWGCGRCGTLWVDKETAVLCCTCYVCHNPPTRPGTVRLVERCAACTAIDHANRAAAMRSLPVAENYDGPVFNWSDDTYYTDIDDALDAWHDNRDEGDPPPVFLPCLVTVQPVPDFLADIDERWARGYDDDQDFDRRDTPAVNAAAAVLETELAKVAPTIWRPDRTRQVKP